jgi:hypothetical protein
MTKGKRKGKGGLKQLVRVVYFSIKQRAQWRKMNFDTDARQELLDLYDKYATDLKRVRSLQQGFYVDGKKRGLRPQLGDIEAEITYMRVREAQPENVVEFSPASGWSTSWILHALKDNGIGKLYSFDLVDKSKAVVDPELADGRWELKIGDVTQSLHLFPKDATYLFIDSAHTGPFAEWYIREGFPLFPKGTKVSAHDIIKYRYQPGCGEESDVLCRWLAEKNIKCATASRAMKKLGYDAFVQKKVDLALDSVIHPADFNSMVFFEL